MTLLLILIVYAGLMIALGAIVSRRVRGSIDFFVAGRGLGAGLIFSTLLAANIGAGSTVGAAGAGFRDGQFPGGWGGSGRIRPGLLSPFAWAAISRAGQKPKPLHPWQE